MTPAFYALALYAGLLGFIAIWLFAHVGAIKNKEKVSIGDGGNARVIRAMRGQANFVENVPMILVLLVIAASMGMPAIAIHVIGTIVVIGRFFHALHFTKADAPGWQRGVGAMTTMLALALCSVGLVAYAVLSLF